MLLIAIGLVAHIWGKKKEKGALNGLTAPLKQTTNEKGKEQHLLNGHPHHFRAVIFLIK